MLKELPQEPSLLSPKRPPGPPTSEMSWSGLIECARDGLSALRQSAEYARSEGFKEKHDILASCITELVSRLGSIGCLPLPGEPSFTLLGRDPQAPARVSDWIEERRRTDDSLRGAEKIAKAEKLRDEMVAWKTSRPQIGHSLPGAVARGAGDRAPVDRS